MHENVTLLFVYSLYTGECCLKGDECMERERQKLESKIQAMEEIFYRQPRGFCERCITVAAYMKILARMAVGMNLYQDSQELNESCIDKLGISGKWYDIGLADMKGDVIDNPYEVDEKQRELYFCHPQRGMALLDDMSGDDIDGRYEDELWCVAMDCCMEHHERWDGGGYPYGLKGDEIRIMGRICAICNDFYERLHTSAAAAMYSPFHYAKREIEREAGGAYDPALVDAFERCFEELKKIGRMDR